MSTVILTLGGIAFRDFEVPEQIIFGGGQILAVHQIIGGTRIVDALGAADGEVSLAGVFSGPDATTRVQALDLARSMGETLPLMWQGFFYSVIISELTAAYTKPWWIPFRLRLVVVQDLVTLLPNILEQTTLDLAAATQIYAPQGGLQTGGISVTSPPNVILSLSSAGAMLSQVGEKFSLAVGVLNRTNNAATGVTAIQNITSGASVLAGLASARAYLGRAAANLSGVSA